MVMKSKLDIGGKIVDTGVPRLRTSGMAAARKAAIRARVSGLGSSIDGKGVSIHGTVANGNNAITSTGNSKVPARTRLTAKIRKVVAPGASGFQLCRGNCLSSGCCVSKRFLRDSGVLMANCGGDAKTSCQIFTCGCNNASAV